MLVEKFTLYWNDKRRQFKNEVAVTKMLICDHLILQN